MQGIINQQITKYIVELSVFIFLWGFKMKMSFMDLEIWLFGFGNVFKGVRTNPEFSCCTQG